MTTPRTKGVIYQEIRLRSQTSPGATESERILHFLAGHQALYDEYVRAPQAPVSTPAPSPAPATLSEALVDHAITRSSKTAERLIDFKARALASKEQVSYQEAVGRILASEPSLSKAYYSGRG